LSCTLVAWGGGRKGRGCRIECWENVSLAGEKTGGSIIVGSDAALFEFSEGEVLEEWRAGFG